MKNYVKEGQKLPLYGVGPMIVFGMGAVTAVGIILSAYVWKAGVLEDPWALFCRIAGALLIASGLAVWFIGALRSDMDACIAENRLQTGGVYAWVRNPMYSGWWMLFAGVCLQWHDASDGFKAHSVYPTTNATHVYAVIAMCLEMKALGMTDAEIIEAVNHGFARRRNFFRRLIRLIDLLPNSFSIAKNWNISDHDRRVKDGSITYDRFDVGQDRIEYSISKCVYIEMFETYGIRNLCKIFCMTDTTSYENLRHHVTFIRHSDLSDGDACHDEIIRRRKPQ